MKREEATVIIKNCLEAEYDTGKYEKLIANILTTQYVKMNRVVWEAYIREAFRDSIGSYTILGNYEDTTKQKIVLLEVRLKNAGSLQNARTMQRNFVADFLRSSSLGRQDAALVAFISPDAKDWRFSLVKMEYSLGIIEGKIKTNEELTPAKRWSFLVGKHEKCHTAQSRFLPLIMEESHGTTLKELEKAFDVETVTDEFFGQYKECFFRFKDEIDRVIASSEQDRAHFESIGLDTANFAKKTLGQLAFLYFLQKKGWFGVWSNNEWGTGPKNFLRRLFERYQGGETYGKNFFNDILEPLFYQALAEDRSDENDIFFRKIFIKDTWGYRIPFLNGGLFEPMKWYSWETTDLTISDEVFSNTNKMKNWDIGDGIFDVFDRYNFTVSEDEPLEKEVAVDPEMLGKIFENLLEIKDRKSTGAFYTPRPIVHYMCQESLIEYLAYTDTTLPRTDIEFFIRESEVTLENDRTTKKKIEEKSQYWYQYSGTYAYKTPESIRSRAKMLDDALANVRIADPAVGSGAFPLGLINEIVRARQILAIYTGSQKSIYDLKLHAIQENIYGVDLNPGAVEICQLRLWLSLIVDETTPHPLPNLNYRIIQGNSLIEEYEGIKLYDPKLLAHTRPVWKNEYNFEKIDLFASEVSQSQKLYDLLQHKLKKFIETSERTEKQNLKREIDQIKYDLIETTLREQGKAEKITEIQRLREENITPFFIWQLEFCEVFQEKWGFDIVIGNPPYIDSEEMSKTQSKIREEISRIYSFTKWNWDIYIAFFELWLSFLKPNGSLTYITPDKWLDKPFWDALRKNKFSSIHSILKAWRDVFRTAKVDSIVSILWSESKEISTLEYNWKNIQYISSFQKNTIKEPYRLGYLFGKNKNITNKIDLAEWKLIDIWICENACATSDAYKLKEIIFSLLKKQDFDTTFFKIINTGTIWKYKSKWGEQEMTYLKDKYQFPVVNRSVFIKNFPNSYSVKTKKQKIIIKGLNLLDACLDMEWEIIPWKTTIIFHSESIVNLKIALSIINSRLCIFYMKSKYESASYNGWISFTKDMIWEFPIPKITPTNQPIVTHIESLVDQILKIKSRSVDQDTLANTATPSLRATPQEGNKTIGTPQEGNCADTSELEWEINRLVYELYGLTSEEIAVVEGSSKE